jgi:glutaconate CoA-transferase subunit B
MTSYCTSAQAEAACLPPDRESYRVITDQAVLGYEKQTKCMQVVSLHPGVSLDHVRAATGDDDDSGTERS